MDDQTRQFGVPGRGDGSGGRPGNGGDNRPRQQFPNQGQDQTRFNPRYTDPGHDYNQGYNQDYGRGYEPYDEPYRPDESRYRESGYREPEKKSNTGMIILGTLLALALLAGIVMFFMWQSAAREANQPPPPPVTVTQTETTTEDAPLIPTEILPRDDQGNPQVPTEWPSDVPTTVPPEVSDGAQDAQEWLDGLLGELESALQ